MSTSEWLSFWQLILSLVIALVGGTLGILGYYRLIKSTDRNAEERKKEIEQNAKDRKEEIERNAKERQETLEDMSRRTLQVLQAQARRNYLTASVIGIAITVMLALLVLMRRDVEKKLKEVRTDRTE